MPFLSRFIGAFFTVCFSATPGVADTTVVRAAVLKIGTVNWELETITYNGFDTAHGFTLYIQPYADNGATRVALEGGTADLMVADWIWTARQRAAGKDYVFIPYSKAVGGIVVPADSDATALPDLAGQTIGIAGGPLDKSWLILRAYAEHEYGFDLAAETQQVYGAPPLIFRTAIAGDLDAAINFWHFLAKMKADGLRSLVTVEDAATALSLDPDTPLIGYVMKESFLSKNPDIAQAIYAASRQAKTVLAEDDAAWDRIRHLMNVANQAEFISLRADFRAGIPAKGNVDPDSADAFLALMAELGGAALVGTATSVPDGLFPKLE
ncbi:MAG: ABC transporter substrate-binding protein [Pseudomonadota bacterium]